MSLLIQQLLNGLSTGAIYALIGLGFVLIFGVARVFNGAQGPIVIVGFYLASVVAGLSGGNFWLALLAATAIGAVFGLLLERLAIAPLASKGGGLLVPFLTTLGFGMVLEGIVRTIFSSSPQPFFVEFASESFKIGDVRLGQAQLFVTIFTILLLVVLDRMIYSTSWGLSARAVAENASIAGGVGISPVALRIGIVALASALAGTTGALYGLQYAAATPTLGVVLTIKGLLVAVIAGLASFRGAVLIGLLLGVTEAMVIAFAPGMPADGFAFVILVALLLFKPAGIFGRKLSGTAVGADDR